MIAAMPYTCDSLYVLLLKVGQLGDLWQFSLKKFWKTFKKIDFHVIFAQILNNPELYNSILETWKKN